MKYVLSLLLALFTMSSAWAWPERPVSLVVPFPPGGSTDLIARVLAPKLQEKLGGSFVTDNKAGATGTIGAAFVARAPADGYTILVSPWPCRRPMCWWYRQARPINRWPTSSRFIKPTRINLPWHPQATEAATT